MANYPAGRIGEYMRLDSAVGQLDNRIDTLEEKIRELRRKRDEAKAIRDAFAEKYPQVKPQEAPLSLVRGMQ
jgi:phage shock protein A